MRSILAFLLLLISSTAVATPDRAAIVKILVVDFDGKQNWLTGSIVEYSGRCGVLTNSHGWRDGCRELHVYSGDVELPAVLVYKDDPDMGHDIALLALSQWTGPAMRLAESEPQIGQVVHHGGFPRGASYELKQGQLIGRHNDGWTMTGKSIGGQSGSAIVDSQGSVVGLLFGCLDDNTYMHGVREIDQALRKAWPKMKPRVELTQYCPPGIDCDQGYVIQQPHRPAPLRGTVASQPLVSPAVPTVNTGQLLDSLASDPRFRGPQGLPGPAGMRGPQGLAGEPGPMPGPEVVREALMPAFEQLRAEVLQTIPVDGTRDSDLQPSEPEPVDWIDQLLQVASALGLEIAIPGGTLGVAAVWLLRTWLRHRVRQPRLDQVDAGRSSPPVARPQ